MHAGGPGRLPLVNLSWTDTWNDLLARASSVVGLDPGVLWPALAILLIVLAWAPARRWGRTLVTIVHEAGHAAVGIMVGRSFRGFVVSRDLSGHAVTAGKPTGPGRVATSWAGYPAPAVLGAVVVLLATSDNKGFLTVCVASPIVAIVLVIGWFFVRDRIDPDAFAAEEARLAATEKAKTAQEEQTRLAIEGAKKAEQDKAAELARKAEQQRVADQYQAKQDAAGPDALARAQHIADAWGGTAETVVVDCETGRFRMGLAADLARRMGAEHVPLEQVAASGLVEIVTDRTASRRSAA